VAEIFLYSLSIVLFVNDKALLDIPSQIPGHLYLSMMSSPIIIFLSCSQVNQRSGLRLSAHGAFLRPVMARPNLHVRSNLHVEKLSLEALEGGAHDEETQSSSSTAAAAAVEAKWPRTSSENTTSGGDRYMVCRGVQVQAAGDANGSLRTLRARKEVILAAGAVGSPHLLQCSGIGPSSLLQQYGVKALHPLSGVGQNLQDHLQIRPVFQLGPEAITLNSWKKAGSLIGQALIGLEYMWQQSGPLAMAPSQLGVFAHSGVPHPSDTDSRVAPGAANTNMPSSSSKLSSSKLRSGGSPGSATAANGHPPTPDLQFHVQPLSLGNLSDSSSLHPFPGVTASVHCFLLPLR
jgi:choline dehydrogenase-like flavoprotein